MTVRELIDVLEEMDEDMKVCIGMQQDYGSNFAYGICDPGEIDVKDWDRGEETYVVLTMGRQFGTVNYEEY